MLAASRLSERVLDDARPSRGRVQGRAVRPARADGAAVPSRQPDPGDHVADQDRLDDRARRHGDGSLAPRREARTALQARTHGLRGRALSAANGSVRQRGRGAVRAVRARLRLRPTASAMAVRRRRVRRGVDRQHEQRPSGAAPHHRPSARHRGLHRDHPESDDRGRGGLRRPVLGVDATTADVGGSHPEAVADHRVLEAVDHGRRVP